MNQASFRIEGFTSHNVCKISGNTQPPIFASVPLNTRSKARHLHFGSERARKSSVANDFHLTPMSPTAPHISALAAIWGLTRRHQKAIDSRDELEEVYVACPREPVIVDSAENKIILLNIHSEYGSKNYGTLDATNNYSKLFRPRVSPYSNLRARLANASWFCTRSARLIVVVATIRLN